MYFLPFVNLDVFQCNWWQRKVSEMISEAHTNPEETHEPVYIHSTEKNW